MSIYAIGDLHLSLAKDKPMSIFGENWKEHEQKIKKNWLEKVKEFLFRLRTLVIFMTKIQVLKT